MITDTKYIALHSICRYLLVVVLTIMSCSNSVTDNEEEIKEPSGSVLLDTSEFSCEATNGTIYYYGSVGTAWSAEIIDGGDFVSFALGSSLLESSGAVVSSARNTLFFYIDQNESLAQREATISFTMSGSEPIELTLSQQPSSGGSSTQSSNEPYDSSSQPRWVEIPTMVDADNYLYVSHFATLNAGQVRNYSLCFDIDNRAAAWVAYPYHSCYDGDVSRTDEWSYDPLIPEEYQPNLTSSYSGDYDRGHQQPSADRLATVEMNEQTFYYSNMTPQLSSLNRYQWASLEAVVRRQMCSDTLYVVTGADFRSSTASTTDRSGNDCPLPGGYYKVLLRTSVGNSNKAIGECSAQELIAIGFWFDHQSYSAIPEPVSVAEIEAKTGFSFFPSIPSQVKESFDKSDWTL